MEAGRGLPSDLVEAVITNGFTLDQAKAEFAERRRVQEIYDAERERRRRAADPYEQALAAIRAGRLTTEQAIQEIRRKTTCAFRPAILPKEITWPAP